MKLRLFLACVLAEINPTAATFFYPNALSSLLEHHLIDTHGAHASSFASAITPCTNYVSGSQNFGRETAAQWLRVAFHDFVTADVEKGTGGLDASIGFETLREENSGSAFNDSFAFFRPYVNGKVSMADLVALSVTSSISNCGGPIVPLRPGRIDALSSGSSGVPAPETSLSETMTMFVRAGFNASDSIALTACGHTMGSVHHGGFPTVVGPEAVSPNNTAGGIHFDSTVDVFDSNVVAEYLKGSGNAGGPLVTSFNVTSRSDKRLYESDGNTTMIKLAEQGEEFLSTCANLMRRMVETVPKGVVLSEAVKPMTVKPVNVSLDFDENDRLVFAGSIRVLRPSTSPKPESITLTPSSSPSSPLILTTEEVQGSSIYGTTIWFPFSTSIVSPTNFTNFTIAGDSLFTTFPVQTDAFIVPSLSSLTTNNRTSILHFTIAAPATKKTLDFDATVQAPVEQAGTLGPAIRIFTNVSMEKVHGNDTEDYGFWKGEVDVGTGITGQVMLVILDAIGEEVDLAFF